MKAYRSAHQQLVRASPTIPTAASVGVFGEEVAAEHRYGEVRPSSDERKHKAKAKLDTDLYTRRSQAIGIEQYKKLVQKETRRSRKTFTRAACHGSRRRVRSWWNPKAGITAGWKIPDEIGTGASVQAMVFGNMGDSSATGVGFPHARPCDGAKTF